MNSLRNITRALLIVVLVAFALPASAAGPQKIYSINVTPLGTVPVAVTIKNETPNGNSTINSFIIQRPGGWTVTPAATPSSAPANVSVGANGNIYVNSFDGLKAGTQTPKAITIYLNVSYGSTPPTCGNTYTWTAAVYTGNSFGQETFDPVVGTSPPTNASQTVTCSYSLTGLPTSIAAGTSASAALSLTNLSPAGSPTITSLALTAPAGMAISPSSVSVNVFPGGTLSIPVTLSASCGAAGGGWQSSANGGAFTRSNALPTTSATPVCKLLLQQPQNVVAGVPFSVQVTAVDGTGALYTPFTGPVNLTLNGSGSLSGGGSLSGSGGIVTYSSLTISSIGQFTLTATSSFGTASANASTAPFTVFAGGPLNCAPNPPFTFNGSVDSGGNPSPGLSITQTGYAAGQRGTDNKDGNPCSAVGYTFTNNILTSNSVNLRWDTASQPGAAFVYTMTWMDEVPDLSAGIPTRRTKVAWEFDASGNPLPGKTVFGVACLSPSLPATYGTLTAAIDASQTAITVNTSATLPAVPFPAEIGSERIQVTAVVGSNWTVVRGTGKLGADAAAHLVNAAVMSTPLPIDPNQYQPLTISGPPNNPYYQKQVQVCISDEGWVAVPGGKVRFTTTVFDIGDGFVSRDF